MVAQISASVVKAGWEERDKGWVRDWRCHKRPLPPLLLPGRAHQSEAGKTSGISSVGTYVLQPLDLQEGGRLAAGACFLPAAGGRMAVNCFLGPSAEEPAKGTYGVHLCTGRESTGKCAEGGLGGD